MKLKKLAAVIGMTAGMAFVANVANSAVLKFEDDDIDWHLDANLNPKSGAFVVGDVLAAVFEIPTFTIDGANGIPAGQELTGVSLIQIDTLVGSSATFVPYSGGLNAILPAAADLADDTGAMLAMWFNGTSGAGGDTDLEVSQALNNGDASCTSLADCVEQASLGDLFQVDGFAGDPDESWTSGAIVPGGFDSSVVAGISASTLVAGFNAKLSNLFQDGFEIAYQDVNTGANCGAGLGPVADGCVQTSVSGTITGGVGLTNGAFAHSDLDAEKLTVPEPGALSLLGLGLVGMGYFSRKRRTA